MTVDILVPPLSQTMDTVVLVEWLKQVGDPVVKGEPLFVIETDKARLDVESPATGILTDLLAEPGVEVQVRSKIGLIAAPHETAPAPQPAKRPLAIAAGLPPARQNRLFASPRARRLAQENGVPLAEVKPTGPQQMIVERDIKAYLAEQAAARPAATPLARRMAQAAGLDLAAIQTERPGARLTRTDVESALSQPARLPEPRWIELSPTRRTIARRLVESQQSGAHITLTRAVDATELVNLKVQILAELPDAETRPTYTDFFVAIVARQLRQHPYLNAVADGERFGLSEAIHIGLAVDTERGLVVPVIKHANQKGLLQLAQARIELVRRALGGAITPAELADGTFTLTNLGALEVDAFTPIINPPQVAVLGVGRIRPGPAVYQGELRIRQLLHLSLTVDHRFIDGAPAARFLADVARLIEKPQLWWL